MENKKYIDKVIEHLVRGTKINYENGIIYLPHFPSLYILFSSLPLFFYHSYSFSEYCKNTFGLTDDEIKYVWKQYREIILSKIEN